jgi:hypothetical protein
MHLKLLSVVHSHLNLSGTTAWMQELEIPAEAPSLILLYPESMLFGK